MPVSAIILVVPKVDRNNPQRAKSSESTYSLMEFMREFPDDATCLEWLWRQRCSDDGSHAHCPKCKQTRKFHKVRSRPSWSCDACGHHMHPTAGTIFHRSATSLHLWFYAMYLMTSTRCAVSAKHLERELGVTYKTAWRMANLIRNKLMVEDGDEPLSGDVELDETLIGGKPRAAAGNYHSVSRKWLQGYLNEFVWRYNRRYVVKRDGKVIRRIAGMSDRAMFLSLIDRATVDVER